MQRCPTTRKGRASPRRSRLLPGSPRRSSVAPSPHPPRGRIRDMGKNAPILSLDPKVVRAFVALSQITEFQASIEKRRDDAGVPGYVRGYDALLARIRGLFEGDETFRDAIGSLDSLGSGAEDDSE